MSSIHPADQDEEGRTPPVGAGSNDPAAPLETAESVAPAAAPLTRFERTAAGAGVAAGALLVLLALMARTGASAGTPADAVTVADAARPAAIAEPSNVTLSWSDANRDTWVSDSRRALAYEVDADRTIGVWMRAVRPTLVVRCEQGALEVFVFTESTARIEQGTADHTVRFQLDEGEEVSELWPDADSHDALFAPDGPQFARRLADARTLRFGFTPHNAEPVMMRFAVAGLAPLLVEAEKAGCRAAGDR